GLPVGVLGAGRLGERITLCIRALEAAQIGAVALAGARHEERHVAAVLRSLLVLRMGRQARGDEKRRHDCRKLHETSSEVDSGELHLARSRAAVPRLLSHLVRWRPHPELSTLAERRQGVPPRRARAASQLASPTTFQYGRLS